MSPDNGVTPAWILDQGYSKKQQTEPSRDVSPYFVDNKFVKSNNEGFFDVHDPSTNVLVSKTPENTIGELEAAVASAKKAFSSWRATSVMARQRIMFKFVSLLRDNMDRIAARITLEQGKTFADAKGDVLRGLQVAEAACGAPEFMKGEVLEVAKDMETRSYREPLGVVSVICPFSTLFSGTEPFRTGSTGADLGRLPRHDPVMVSPYCSSDWKYCPHQAL